MPARQKLTRNQIARLSQLSWLGSWYPMPTPRPNNRLLSFGDVCLALGAAWQGR
ncbi:DUF5317 family protein [Vibrio metschnikovii]|uniref:DUF5317 family protein n=1 Tax=Vibrio metschnikovii TaxID=28172 RepID=UPI00142EC4BD|nr:DUF5317 family protein [Vibrio metschnikovii]EKO3689085.1 DUF5317 family protein [Vibrio metschnikovii]